VVRVNWANGTALTMAIGPLGDGIARIASAVLDLTDDRTFLSERHRDLVEMLPNLSIHAEQAPTQGWIRVGVGGASCELHVLLRPLPLGTDLVLGRCATELLAAAAVRLMERDGAAEKRNETEK
jgi:hypothetical protein